MKINVKNKEEYTLPDRTKCFICNHVFTDDEIRWASPVRETLCGRCHKDYISPHLNEEDRQLKRLK